MSKTRGTIRDDNCEAEQVVPLSLIHIGRSDRLRLRSDRCYTQETAVEPVLYPPDQEVSILSEDTSTPPSLVILNAEFTLNCGTDSDEPPIGVPVIVSAGTINQTFDWRSIPHISTDRLAYIASLSEPTRVLSVTWASSAFPDVVESYKTTYKITTSQARYVWETIGDLLVSLDALVFNAASSQLDCRWWNTEQIASCPNDPDDTDLPSVTMPIAVAADQFSSKISQEDANEQAVLYGQGLLDCLYGNTGVTVVCEENTDGFENLGYPDVVPTDTDTGQVGQYSIPSGFVTSPDGSIAATALATEIALSNLNCFYLSSEVYLDCDGLGKFYAVDNGPADPFDTDGASTGWSVTLPAGFFRSELSQQDAEDQALILAESFLECYWVNTSQTAQCDGWVPGDPTTSPYGSSLYYVTVAPGVFRSDVGQADAESQALIFAESQLICNFYNNAVCAYCDDPGILPPHVQSDIGFARICFPDGVQPYNNTDIAGPYNGKTFTLPSAGGPLTVAFQYSGFPGDPPLWYTPAAGDIIINIPYNTSGNSGDSLADLLLTALPGSFLVYRNLYIDPEWGYDTDCGAYQEPPEASVGFDTCAYVYSAGIMSTPVDLAGSPYDLKDGTFPGSTTYFGPYVSPDHPSARSSYGMAAGTVISTTSQSDADQQAYDIASGNLLCLWGNDRVQGGYYSGSGSGGGSGIPGPDLNQLCESGVARYNPGLAANTISGSSGKWAVNNEAKQLAAGLVTCATTSSGSKPDFICGEEFEVNSEELNPYFKHSGGSRDIVICPGLVVGYYLRAGAIKWEGAPPFLVDPSSGATIGDLDTQTVLECPASTSFYLYFTAGLTPINTHSATTHVIAGDVWVVASGESPESPYRTTYAPFGKSGRLWTPLAYIETNATKVTRAENLHTGNLTVVVK